MPSDQTITCEQFTNYLVAQEPIYDERIIRDIRPEDDWVPHVKTEAWNAFSGTEHTFDRFRHVSPNVTKPWQAVSKESCIGAPCDPPSSKLGWGYDRRTYALERKSLETDLLCFDQIIHVNRAKQHFAQIISDILKPATKRIASDYLRRRFLDLAGEKWVTDATMSDFTFTWELDADGNEVILNTTDEPTSKLTPQMLQRRVSRLQLNGYFGKQPFRDMPPLIEVVTDKDTMWDLDKAACNSSIAERWRFNEWEMQNKYWKYAYQGSIGDFVLRADLMPLRFNRLSANRFQYVDPYVNGAATVGIGSDVNPAFDLAQYQLSFITHRAGVTWLTQQMASVNPEMPFLTRSLGGKWHFAIDNLGEDSNGCVINNMRRNKGLFYADFEYSAKGEYVEFVEAIFHLREPACIVECLPCNTDPGYPTQDYNADNDPCPAENLTFDVDTAAPYTLGAITCNGVPQDYVNPGDRNNLGDVVAWLVANMDHLGTWTLVDGNTIQLANSTCESVTLTIDGV